MFRYLFFFFLHLPGLWKIWFCFLLFSIFLKDKDFPWQRAGPLGVAAAGTGNKFPCLEPGAPSWIPYLPPRAPGPSPGSHTSRQATPGQGTWGPLGPETPSSTLVSWACVFPLPLQPCSACHRVASPHSQLAILWLSCVVTVASWSPKEVPESPGGGQELLPEWPRALRNRVKRMALQVGRCP